MAGEFSRTQNKLMLDDGWSLLASGAKAPPPFPLPTHKPIRLDKRMIGREGGGEREERFWTRLRNVDREGVCGSVGAFWIFIFFAARAA